MDQAVTHEGERPVWYKRNVVFTKLVVDVVSAGVGSELKDFIVFFVGTTVGDVYKIVQWFDEKGHSNSRLIDVYPVTNPEPVRAMTISPRVRLSPPVHMLFFFVPYMMKACFNDIFLCF
jgi:hypothetical protein